MRQLVPSVFYKYQMVHTWGYLEKVWFWSIWKVGDGIRGVSSTKSRSGPFVFCNLRCCHILHCSSLIPHLHDSRDHLLKIKFVEPEKYEINMRNLPVWIIVSCAAIQNSAKSVSMTLNSTVRMPPRTRKVSPFCTGLYAARTTRSVYGHPTGKRKITFKEVGFQINVENSSAKTLDWVVKRQNVDQFSIFNVETLMYGDEVTEFDSQIATSYLVTWIRPSSTSSELKQMRTASHRFLPL